MRTRNRDGRYGRKIGGYGGGTRVLIPEVEGSVAAETMPGALELLERLRSLPETLPRR
jgi:hypothetical protein